MKTAQTNPTQTTDAVRDTAILAARCGIFVVPPRPDGTELPDTAARFHIGDPPTIRQVRERYREPRTAVGVITGRTSRNLECLEFAPGEYEELQRSAAWWDLAELVDHVAAGYLEETPLGGRRLLYRCQTLGPSERLRRVFPDVGPARIQLHGEGSYLVIAPSTVQAGEFKLLSGSPLSIQLISPEEREALHALAREGDQCFEPGTRLPDLPPWWRAECDDMSWDEILNEHGIYKMREEEGFVVWNSIQNPFFRAYSQDYEGGGWEGELFQCLLPLYDLKPDYWYSKSSARWTLMQRWDRRDLDDMRALRELEVLHPLQVPEDNLPLERPGWPDEWGE